MLKKKITFIYMESSEKAFMDILANEAKSRGYDVKVTDDKFSKNEIGVYCQHVNFPQNSKFSVIMLHDIIQQYGNWPDIWYREPWNKYDIGILPSMQWVDNWKKSSHWSYSRPKRGVFLAGWPKADIIYGIDKQSYREDFYKKWGMRADKKTILYAPAWENSGKQDDFVQAMLSLDVNILIKQYDADPIKFPYCAKCIEEMEEKYRDDKRVITLPKSLNIINAILAADVLVSEESSTMCEAVMLGVPAVSVSDWLIPDTIPFHYPKCDYTFVTKTSKANLQNCILDILNDYEKYREEAEAFSRYNFSNIGKSSMIIMDIIDDCVNGVNIRYPHIEPSRIVRMPINKFKNFVIEQIHRQLRDNWRERSRIFNYIWEILKKMAKDTNL